MYLKGRVYEDDGFWLAELDAFCIATQGTSKTNAKDMLKDAIRALFEKFEFELNWADKKNGEVYLEPVSPSQALDLIIYRSSHKSDLTTTLNVSVSPETAALCEATENKPKFIDDSVLGMKAIANIFEQIQGRKISLQDAWEDLEDIAGIWTASFDESSPYEPRRVTKTEALSEFNCALRAFTSGEGFDSRIHRLKCIDEIIEIRKWADAMGSEVMTENELLNIIGDF